MSFDRLSAAEQGRSGRNYNNNQPPARSSIAGGSYTDDPDFTRLYQSLTTKLFKLNGNNQRLSGEISHLGTRRDTPRVRERVHELIEESRDLFKSVGEGVKKIQTWDEDVTPTQKYHQQKLSRDFTTSLTEFQSLQRTALEKQKASVSVLQSALPATSPSHQPQVLSSSHGSQQQLLLQEQELARLAPQDEVDFQEALILEREEEIRNIEQGVGDLNVLFQQVAQIVNEQGETLDTIVNNVENVRDDTRGADRELRSAARYQKNARSKACCLLLILVVILTVVLLAVFLG
ncbi:SNAP receptor [Podospora bellae-mahoneyi]|uniref:SNAP receptor n=1 Tax=Podospora bellae-mahoneyi TaxID=2093777 RepID=A0ABR0FPW0_9PEZI|nr:SNAP receptor [Podospora bellae-mahoneyi]